MRQLSLVVSLLSVYAFASAQNVAELEMFEKAMKPGTVLIYDVKQGGKQYQLTATIKKLGAEVGFEWNTTAPSNLSGSVNMSTNAITKAEALLHSFQPGESKLEIETSLWLSKKIQADVGANAAASLKIFGATDTVTAMSNTISEVGFMLDGAFITVPGWELEGGSEIKYLVGAIESIRFPLIYRLDTGWTMLLSEVKSQ